MAGVDVVGLKSRKGVAEHQNWKTMVGWLGIFWGAELFGGVNRQFTAKGT